MNTDPTTQREFFGGRAKLMACPSVTDHRGVLQPFDFDRLPFVPRRSFTVTNVPAGAVRGGHAHRFGTQLLVCLHGRIEILMRLQHDEVGLVLVPSSFGLVFGPGVWCQQRYAVAQSVLLAFASDAYDPKSYLDAVA